MKSTWLGRPCYQSVADLWAYQGLLTETAPDLIVELGAGMGGTALYFATLCALVGGGRVVTVDRGRTHHNGYRPVLGEERIRWLLGDLADLTVFDQIRAYAQPGMRTMVLHDADHDAALVLRDLELYARLVTPGCYFVVCDTNLDGPAAAVQAFLALHPEFQADRSREPEGTWNPGGYLRRIKGSAHES